MSNTSNTPTEPKAAYRVLARKYRPAHFGELIGQDALVRTLTNAISSNRIAHAFMLTGVRGVGKTTTARIIARALNYTGPNGKAGPTTGPTDDCAVCQSIAEGRHPDVLEMDAASRTGVDDIREILDGVRYAPASARYKIYIIDEVHMLSKGAFNALLKTLEEPPPHVKFIFATTEIRKVPVTVLSRCQRFDLRRVDVPVLEGHYASICEKESVAAEPDAVSMIARAADGSVRDGLSLLDQAMAMTTDSNITADQVRDMLGLADRGRVLDLLGHALKGETAEALGVMADLHQMGADPASILQDMLDLTHIMTRLRVAPKTKDMPADLSPDALDRAMDMAQKMTMPTLGRAWQLLLKGLGEVHMAPNPQNAAEMVIIRLIYAADLPDPSDLLKKLKDGKFDGGSAGATTTQAAPSRTPEPVGLRAVAGGSSVMMQPAAQPDTEVALAPGANLTSLRDVVTLLEQHREMMWATELYQNAHLVKLQPGRLEIRTEDNAHPKLAQEAARALSAITGQRWIISISSSSQGDQTLAQQDRAVKDQKLSALHAHPVVAEIITLFPQAKLDIKEI